MPARPGGHSWESERGEALGGKPGRTGPLKGSSSISHRIILSDCHWVIVVSLDVRS